MISDTHSLKLLALQCLKKENERPSALQLSDGLFNLKKSLKYIECTHQAEIYVQQLELQLQQQKILTDINKSENEECHAQIKELTNRMEKHLQEHQHEKSSLEQEIKSKERELHQVQEQLQVSEQLLSEFQQSLHQRDKIITDLQQNMLANERKVQQLQHQHTASRDQPQDLPVTSLQTAEVTTQKDISKTTRRSEKNAPMKMWRGAATVHGNTVYLRPGGSRSVFSYQKHRGVGQWSLLPDVPNGSGSLIVMQDLLTSVGGI